jgi:hypothetical protein
MAMRTAEQRVAALRAPHTVKVVILEGVERCEVDGVRVYPIKTGYRHDSVEVVALNKAVPNEVLGVDEALRPKPISQSERA